MLDFIPDPIAFQIGPLPVYWYGIGYAIGLAVAYQILVRLARRAGEDPEVVGNGMIIVAIAALIGGRLYHVIDQWALYQDDLLTIVLPPYTGLGVYGGIATGLVAVVVYSRIKGLPFWRWADIIAPALFAMQAVARWGNFFNQELYGPPTTLPWGIPIDCAHRIAAYACPPGSDPAAVLTERFHPLFLYESLSGVLGGVVLIWLGFRLRDRLRPGDLILLFFAWYGVVRFGLEFLRQENWTFQGIPTAQIVSLLFIVPALAVLVWRHRPVHPDDDPPSRPAEATWGAIGRSAGSGSVDATIDESDPAAAQRPAGSNDVPDEDDPVDVLI
jgi:phosphatidylglycerol:prolipoprotein diacylglycerol transferase